MGDVCSIRFAEVRESEEEKSRDGKARRYLCNLESSCLTLVRCCCNAEARLPDLLDKEERDKGIVTSAGRAQSVKISMKQRVTVRKRP